MSVMYIEEFREMSGDKNGMAAPIVLCNGDSTSQAVTFSTTAQSAAFQNDTKIIRVICTAEAHLKFGDSPVATTSSGIQMRAGTVEYFGVVPGQKIAAVSV